MYRAKSSERSSWTISLVWPPVYHPCALFRISHWSLSVEAHLPEPRKAANERVGLEDLKGARRVLCGRIDHIRNRVSTTRSVRIRRTIG